MSAGPFDTERQVLDAIGYPARPWPPVEASELALLDACARAGVQLGEYDRRIIAWLATHSTAAACGVVAGIILRAGDHS